jgi:glycine cleavage system regulatory protein
MTRRAFTAEIDASAVPTRRPTVLNHSLVLMCSGPDDKDVLPLIAQTVTKLSGSIEESRMTCLGADFTVSTLLTIPMTVSPQTVEQDILSALPDFTVACRLTSPAPASSSYEPAKILALDVEGPDQPKIVTTFAQTLYRHNVAIKDVITDTSSAPFLGYNVFAMKAVVSIPLKTDMKQLEADLQTFEAQFGLNLAVSDPAEQQQQQQPGAPGQQPQH